MTCSDCVHYSVGYDSVKKEFTVDGSCHRMPVVVNKAYFDTCGEFKHGSMVRIELIHVIAEARDRLFELSSSLATTADVDAVAVASVGMDSIASWLTAALEKGE